MNHIAQITATGVDKATVEVFKSFREATSLYECFELALLGEYFLEVNVTLPHFLDSDQRIKWALFAAKSVLALLEDDRPRKAIEAVETYLADTTEAHQGVCALAAVHVFECAQSNASIAVGFAANTAVDIDNTSSAILAINFAASALGISERMTLYRYGLELLIN